MPESPEWPSYPTGPKDSIYAIGVISTKFTELESVLGFMFGTVFGLDIHATTIVASKIGNEPCVDLIKRRLPKNEWTKEINEHVLYFIDGFEKCLDNRNHLSHSNLAFVTDHTVLFKTSKKGETLAAMPKLLELRQVADDMHAYAEYGRWLVNFINNNLSPVPVFAGAAFPLPDKPPLPHTLSYSSGPQVMR